MSRQIIYCSFDSYLSCLRKWRRPNTHPMLGNIDRYKIQRGPNWLPTLHDYVKIQNQLKFFEVFGSHKTVINIWSMLGCKLSGKPQYKSQRATNLHLFSYLYDHWYETREYEFMIIYLNNRYYATGKKYETSKRTSKTRRWR